MTVASLPMPPKVLDFSMTDEKLLEAYLTAVDHEENAFTTRQASAWSRFAKECRKEILHRMKEPR